MSQLLLTIALSYHSSMALASKLVIDIPKCPGPAKIEVSGITPGSPYTLYNAKTKGNGAVPNGPCAGTPLELEAATLGLLYTQPVDNNGSDTEDGFLVPQGMCANYAQVIDLSNCSTSNTARFCSTMPLSPSIGAFPLLFAGLVRRRKNLGAPNHDVA